MSILNYTKAYWQILRGIFSYLKDRYRNGYKYWEDITINLSDLNLNRFPIGLVVLRLFSPNISLLCSNNNLQQIPKWLLKLKIHQLDLSNNNLEVFPAQILKMQRMGVLDLSNNRLNSIPSLLGNLNNMKSLEVSHNQLTNLPSSISTLPKLVALHVKNNNLSNLPISFSNLKTLATLDVSNNTNLSTLFNMFNLKSLGGLDIRNTAITQLPKGFEVTELFKGGMRPYPVGGRNIDGSTMEYVHYLLGLEFDYKKMGMPEWYFSNVEHHKKHLDYLVADEVERKRLETEIKKRIGEGY